MKVTRGIIDQCGVRGDATLCIVIFFMGTNFRGLSKIKHSWGSKFVAIVFSFIIHIENYCLVGTEIRGSDPPQQPGKLVPHKI